MISALKVNFRCWKNVVMSRVLYQNFGTCGVHTIMILYHMAVWHDTKAALGTQAAASTNRDSIWYPALALEAIRLIQYTGPDGSRVVKLLASGTVLSSHWLTRGELMWDTATFFPHTRLERVGIIAYTAKVRSLSHYIPSPVESQRIDTTVSASLAEMNVSWKQESISRHTVVLLSSFNSHNSKSFDSSTFAINFPLPVDGGNQYCWKIKTIA